MATGERLRIGCWLELPSPEIAEITAAAGYDFAVLDVEHGAIGIETLGRMLAAFAASPTATVVRVPEAGEGWIKHALDAGAGAVMVPRVEDAATAARLSAFATYGPAGRRGEGLGVARASRWGREPGAYRDRWRATGGLVLQIESPAGLAAAAAIAATPGVTQLFFGPADFAAALGVDRGDPQVAAGARGTAEAARAAGREAGVFPFPGAGFAALAAMGFTHAAEVSDVGLLVGGLADHLAATRAGLADG
ncbi:MAG: aldolase/citrate lyase family protein [Amaricoccus sp.]